MMDPLRDGGAWLTPLVGLTGLIILSLAEARCPLRPRSEARWRRMLRNVATGAVAQVMAIPLRAVAVFPLAVLVEQRGWGLLQFGSLPPWEAA